MPSCPVQLYFVSPQARALYSTPGGLSYATNQSAGLDLRACLISDEVYIPAGQRFSVPTGVVLVPRQPGAEQKDEPAVAGFVYSRSGLGAVQGLTVAQGVGVIDPDYRGEIFVALLNTSGCTRRLRRGERMAQIVFQPFYRAELTVVDALDTTERGAGGFGHSGR